MLKAKESKHNIKLLKNSGFNLFLMNLPFLFLVFLLCYLPIYGWAYAFFDYKPGLSLFDTKFVGLKYFNRLVQDRYAILDIARVLKNTFAMNFIGYLYAPIPMIFALFLSEVRGRHFKKIVQTLTTLPHFISWVLVFSVAYAMFSVGDGLFNKILLHQGLIDTPINFLINPDHTWLKMSLWTLWKGFGWNSILYFAAISGIDQELYEAAHIDGAGRFRIMWYITIPHLIPTFFVILVLSIAHFLNTGMEQYFLFSNPMNLSQIEVLDLYVYNQGITKGVYPYATAISMLKSIIGVLLLFMANKLSKIVRGVGVI